VESLAEDEARSHAISYEEMRQMIGYLWSAQFFDPRGDPAKGKRVF